MSAVKTRPVEHSGKKVGSIIAERLAHGGKPRTGKKTIVITHDGVCHHECHDDSELAGLALTGGIRADFDLLLSLCGDSVSHPDRIRRGRAGLCLSQAGRRIPLGWRGVRATVGLRSHLLPVAGDRHLVSNSTDLWLRGTGLYLVAASFRHGLAGNKLYTIIVLLAVYWFVTLFTFRGMSASSKLSSLGGLFGTIIPGAILIILGVIYVAMGKPIQMALNTGFFPNFGNFSNMVLAAGVFLFFAGMEMQAVHIQHLKNPSRNYPLSVFLATIIVVAMFVLGTLAVGVVIPHKAINLNQSLLHCLS